MKKYSCILADPTWDYMVWSKKGAGRSAENHYPTMKPTDTCALPMTGSYSFSVMSRALNCSRGNGRRAGMHGAMSLNRILF